MNTYFKKHVCPAVIEYSHFNIQATCTKYKLLVIFCCMLKDHADYN